MKTPVGSRLTALFAISSLIFPTSVFATATGTPPPSTTNADTTVSAMGNCTLACAQYKSASAEQGLTSACGPPPAPGQPAIAIKNNGTTFNSYEDCKKSIYGAGDDIDKAARWGVLGQHCDAQELYKSGKDMDMFSAIPYTASAVACGLACAAQATKAIPWLTNNATLLDTACLLVGLGAAGADVYADIKISNEGSKASTAWEEWYQRKAGYAGTALGMVGAGTAVGAKGAQVVAGKANEAAKNAGAQETAVTVKVAEEALEQATKAFADESAKMAELQAKVMKNRAAGIFDKTLEDAFKAAKAAQTKANKTLEAAGSKLKATKASKVGKALSCVSMAFFAAAAAVKWANYATNGNLAQSECENIQKMAGIGTANLILPVPTVSPAAFQVGSATPADALKPSAGSTFGDGSEYASHVNDKSSTFPAGAVNPNVFTSAASIFDKMPNKDQIPSLLSQFGTPMSDLTKRLAATSPGALVASVVPGLSPEQTSMLKEVDTLAKSGKFQFTGQAPVATYASGGAGAVTPTEAADPKGAFAMLRRNRAKQPTNPREISFEKPVERPTLPADGDIWHASFKGTLFEVASIRIENSQDKVIALEWVYPLNRALSGLAPLAPGQEAPLVNPPKAPASTPSTQPVNSPGSAPATPSTQLAIPTGGPKK
jgi:hypothetical protein